MWGKQAGKHVVMELLPPTLWLFHSSIPAIQCTEDHARQTHGVGQDLGKRYVLRSPLFSSSSTSTSSSSSAKLESADDWHPHAFIMCSSSSESPSLLCYYYYFLCHLSPSSSLTCGYQNRIWIPSRGAVVLLSIHKSCSAANPDPIHNNPSHTRSYYCCTHA